MLPSFSTDTDLAGIKLLATDMDLTLLHDDKSMPAGLDNRIDALMKRGILFCAASGRPAPALRQAFPHRWKQMGLIADNGASVYCCGEAIYKSLIDRGLYHELIDRIIEDGRGVPVLCCFEEAYALKRDKKHHDELSIYYKNINYVEDFSRVTAESNKVSILCPNWNSTQLFNEVFEPEFGNRLYVTCAGDEWIDFMNLGVDKGAGMRRLAKHLSIDLADVAACGDTHNDIPMLDIVGHSFLVANAAGHMEQYARFRCPSNNNDGVLAVIDAILSTQ